MSAPSAAPRSWAERVLAREGALPGDAAACAAAAAAAYDKIDARLAPLLGAVGVRALFVRSGKLARGEAGCLGDRGVLDSSAALRACLQGAEPAIVHAAAVSLFAHLFALLATLIGERLSTEALRSAWPDVAAATETES